MNVNQLFLSRTNHRIRFSVQFIKILRLQSLRVSVSQAGVFYSNYQTLHEICFKRNVGSPNLGPIPIHLFHKSPHYYVIGYSLLNIHSEHEFRSIPFLLGRAFQTDLSLSLSLFRSVFLFPDRCSPAYNSNWKPQEAVRVGQRRQRKREKKRLKYFRKMASHGLHWRQLKVPFNGIFKTGNRVPFRHINFSATVYILTFRKD